MRLKRSIELFPASDGSVYLLRSPAGEEFAVGQLAEADRVLLDQLARGFASPAELAGLLRSRDLPADHVGESLGQLERAGVIEWGGKTGLLTPSQAERYDRQLIYFADLAGRDGGAEQLQRRLLEATVVVLGCGGLGSWTACGLACAGVGSLILVDDDRVELSNLNRQLLFAESDLGELKVKAATRALRRHNSELTVHPVERQVTRPAELAELLEDADLVIATADWPPHELPRWVNRACLDARVPYLTAGQFPPLVRVGPMVLPGRSACLECLERGIRRSYPLYDELAAHRTRHPVTAATMGAVSGLVGSMLAMEAIHLLVGVEAPASVDTAVIVDLRTMRLTHEDVARDPDCPLCSGLRSEAG